MSTTPTVVSDHRMVLSLSRERTTLWDQFQYAGDPAEFVWLLPIFDDSRVEFATSTDDFLSWVDALTAPSFTVTWPLTCINSQGSSVRVDPQRSWPSMSFAQLSPAFDVGDPDSPRTRSALVGPYEVFLIPAGPRDRSLLAWADTHGVRIEGLARTLVDEYDARGAGYVVARLRPGVGAKRMQPIRITFAGYQPRLPLKMIALGAGDAVTLSLFVLSDGAMRVRGKPEYLLDGTMVPFVRSTPEYARYVENTVRPTPGAWLTESSQDATETLLGPSTVSASVHREVQYATTALPRPYVTRFRTVLTRDSLSEDLELEPSTSGPLQRSWIVNGTISPTDCDTFQANATPALPPGTVLEAGVSAPGATIPAFTRQTGCSCATPARARSNGMAALVAAALAMTSVARRRK
ncbi:MAG: DUF2330 domain-containing protein [Myxococcales bacterium]|nr:DUF2330 domain-containing protein [Myxococcales bacterium]